MKPRKPPPEQDDLLRARLVEMIDMRHELVKLETLIDWGVFEREWVGFFPSHTGRPATLPHLVAPRPCRTWSLDSFIFNMPTHSRTRLSWRVGPRTRIGSISAARRSFSTVCRLTLRP